MKQIDKLSEWLREAVQGGSKAPLASQKEFQPQAERAKGKIPFHPKTMRFIPIGGLEEVGKNCMIVEYENDIVAIDMGFQFPEDELFGVDYVIPDIQYLVERKHHLKAILITHGHLDHIGALAYVLPDLGFPTIYGSALSLGLIQKQLEEHKLLRYARLKLVDNRQTYHFGQLQVDFFRVNHSIPDAFGIFIKSPAGTMIHTGDFKFDFTPADGVECDIRKLSDLGKRGVNLLFSDSTNALKPGHTISERFVAENLEASIANAKGRILIACFSSMIGRIQQVLDFAHHHRRKVFLSGGSLLNNFEIARQLGFLKFPKDLIMDIRKVNQYADREVLVLTTGAQGEPMAALSRMATKAHAQVKIHEGDTVVVSSSPIPGNEKQVAFLVDALSRLGAHVVHNQMMDVHASGHGQQEDLKLMMSIVKPNHLVPIHGNFYMRRAHGDLAKEVGIPKENVHLLDNGNVIEVKEGAVHERKEDVKVRYVVIEGTSRGDMGSQVLKEREAMAQNGLISLVVKIRKGHLEGRPIITLRGFVGLKEQQKALREIDKKLHYGIQKINKNKGKPSLSDYEHGLRSEIAGFALQRFNKRPIILPVILFV